MKKVVQNADCVFAYFCGGHKNTLCQMLNDSVIQSTCNIECLVSLTFI